MFDDNANLAARQYIRSFLPPLQISTACLPEEILKARDNIQKTPLLPAK